MKTGITQIIKTFFQQSFMTVVFAIPNLPRSMESGVRMEISGCRFKKHLNHLLDGPLLVLTVTSLFLSILIISRAKACLIYDFFSLCILIVKNCNFVFTFVIFFYQYSCTYPSLSVHLNIL